MSYVRARGTDVVVVNKEPKAIANSFFACSEGEPNDAEVLFFAFLLKQAAEREWELGKLYDWAGAVCSYAQSANEQGAGWRSLPTILSSLDSRRPTRSHGLVPISIASGPRCSCGRATAIGKGWVGRV